ncbi:MAG: hypothetical protein M1514_03780 [Patescibacteria group bacterium]|nr:hypothetical protein [Patescibacteria group bacterium]
MSDLPSNIPKKYWWIGVIVYAISIVFTFLGSRKLASSQTRQECNQVCGTGTQEPNLPGEQNKSSDGNKEICPETFFQGKEGNWETKFYSGEKDGFWCVNEGWEDPVMWFKEGLRPNFKKIIVNYEIRKDEKKRVDRPPSLIVAYGKTKPIFKLWTPEGGSLQLFGFAKNPDFELTELVRDPPETLSDSVKKWMKDVLEIDTTLIEGNNLSLNFLYKHTSLNSGQGVSEIIQKVVKVPDSDAKTTMEKYQLGVGTYKGNCIRIISYKICE